MGNIFSVYRGSLDLSDCYDCWESVFNESWTIPEPRILLKNHVFYKLLVESRCFSDHYFPFVSIDMPVWRRSTKCFISFLIPSPQSKCQWILMWLWLLQRLVSCSPAASTQIFIYLFVCLSAEMWKLNLSWRAARTQKSIITSMVLCSTWVGGNVTSGFCCQVTQCCSP